MFFLNLRFMLRFEEISNDGHYMIKTKKRGNMLNLILPENGGSISQYQFLPGDWYLYSINYLLRGKFSNQWSQAFIFLFALFSYFSIVLICLQRDMYIFFLSFFDMISVSTCIYTCYQVIYFQSCTECIQQKCYFHYIHFKLAFIVTM